MISVCNLHMSFQDKNVKWVFRNFPHMYNVKLHNNNNYCTCFFKGNMVKITTISSKFPFQENHMYYFLS